MDSKMFDVLLFIDNGMERFRWRGFIFANDKNDAIHFVIKKKNLDSEIVRVLHVQEYVPLIGEIFLPES